MKQLQLPYLLSSLFIMNESGTPGQHGHIYSIHCSLCLFVTNTYKTTNSCLCLQHLPPISSDVHQQFSIPPTMTLIIPEGMQSVGHYGQQHRALSWAPKTKKVIGRETMLRETKLIYKIKNDREIENVTFPSVTTIRCQPVTLS